MLERTKVIQKLIDDNNYESYLEIGYGNGQNFNDINIEQKVSVDPEGEATHNVTSDEYFEHMCAEKFDIVFVDGLHHADQAERDVLNSLKVLNKGGTIVVHDCLPKYKAHQAVPRTQQNWTGDVWKAMFRLHRRKDIKIEVLKVETGIGLITRGRTESIEVPEEMDYSYFVKNKDRVYNIIENL